MALALLIVGSSFFEMTLHAHPVASTRPKTISTTAVIKKTTSSKVTPIAKPAPPPTPPTPAPPSPAPKPKPAVPTPAIKVYASVKPQPVIVPSPSSNVSGLTPVAPVTTPSPAPTTPPTAQTTTSYTSSNWSGYMATSGNFNAVSASWTATNPTGTSGITTADSTWIGIGGVSSSDLIQVGTQNIIAANGHVSSSAFYEMLPNVSQTVPGVTVSPGDSMSASLTEISSGQWSISLIDKTNNQTWASTIAYTSTNSSAEWIEEDPSYSNNRLIPFDNYGSATFTNGFASVNGASASIAANNSQPIIMLNRAGQPVSTPSALTSDGAGFTATHS